ncbi:MAG: DUF433 domain-containing protein [Gemmataceae bacterium]|nr:DUF433 domain-containing protein [Gemmataceae bacterium]MCI0739145.1 DUF433 domain-containing protein [Gemmataceae bacterium]
MSENSTEYVTQTPHGSWRIAGTRVSLDSVVHAYWGGRLPEAIAADFPSLSLEQIHGAIAFYLRHRAAIDQYLSEQDARWQQFQEQSAAQHGPLLQRVRSGIQPTPTGSDA